VPNTGASPEVKTTLDALHSHFDLNRDQLMRDFQLSEEQHSHQQMATDTSSTRPKNTTVNCGTS